jgi:hypothetical protein
MKVAQVDLSGLRGTGTRNGSVLRTKDTPSDPINKTRPFGSTTGRFPQWTEPPRPMEDVDHGIEGSGGKRQRRNNRI